MHVFNEELGKKKDSEILKWLEIRTSLGYKYIPVSKIIYIKADNKSSIICFKEHII